MTLITCRLRCATNRCLPQARTSVTPVPAVAVRNGSWRVRVTVLAPTEGIETSRALQQGLLDASADRDKRQGGVIVHLLAAWLFALALLMAWGVGKVAGIALQTWG